MKKRLLLMPIIALLAVSLISAADCEIAAKSTNAFLAEIPDFNAKLSSCNITLPSPLNMLFRTEIFNIQIFMSDGSKKDAMMKLTKGVLTEITTTASSNPTYIIGIGECELDTLLRGENKKGVIGYLHSSKKIIITPVGFFRKIKFGLTKIFAGNSLKKSAVEANISCSTEAGGAKGKKKVGEVCNHGGECETGNCVGVGQGPPWTYECSCNAFRYVAADTDGKCPPQQ